MALKLLIFLVAILLVNYASVANHFANASHEGPIPFNRSSFPADFLFGASSAAYQYEGAAFEDGKGRSIWDTFTHNYPEKILDRSNGDVAEDFYHRYKDDIKLMKLVGLDAFRFSISWPRVLPSGKLSGGVNKKGVDFYNNLINELISNGIKPFVTIFHWDLPQALDDEYGGFLSPRIVDDYLDFIDLCFQLFGDRVKHWITFNEHAGFAYMGYDFGIGPPGRCSSWIGNCAAGNSGTEPYIVGHNILLAHAASVKLYREKYQGKQKGEIGITIAVQWMIPFSKSRLDKEAAQRALDFSYGGSVDPIIYGDYPQIMHKLVGERLPKFTAEQAKMLKGSFDFIGLNYYTAFYASHAPFRNAVNISTSTDSQSIITTERNGKPIGEPTGSSNFYVYPRGLRDVLAYTKAKYNNPPIYITENGMADISNVTVAEGVKDAKRIDFFRSHLSAVHEVIKMGGNVKGFFAWSFLDTFEWILGYNLRFGLFYVDYKDGLKRYPKSSALWFKKFLLEEIKN